MTSALRRRKTQDKRQNNERASSLKIVPGEVVSMISKLKNVRNVSRTSLEWKLRTICKRFLRSAFGSGDQFEQQACCDYFQRMLFLCLELGVFNSLLSSLILTLQDFTLF